MKLSGFCKESSIGAKLIIVLLLIMWGALIMAIPLFFIHGDSALLVAMYLQNILMFILPAWIAALLFWGNPVESLHLDKAPRLIELVGVTALFFVAMPALNRLVEWNEAIHLPDALSGVEQWMRQQELAAAEVTQQILQINSLTQLLAVVLGIGVLTGIGEEFIFRGMLQRIVADRYRRSHLAVWICAFLFSAIHLQFFGFFPRLLLGAIFGYLLVWSGNLWLPIFAHILNNSFVVCYSYFMGEQAANSLPETIGTSGNSTDWVAWASIAAAGILLYLLRKKVLTRNIK